MATIKAYTDLPQSKKLAEILSSESADMYYMNGTKHVMVIPNYETDFFHLQEDDIPAWSLVALLSAVDFSTINLHYDKARMDWIDSATIHDSTKHCTKYESTRALNPIDAAYEMIIKLHK